MSSTKRSNAGQRGIQSVEVGGTLLQALADEGRPMALKDLAAAAGMSAAKAHPYLVSFGKVGLVAQDDASGHYGLGPLAAQLGLIALQQIDPVRLASEALPDLARAVGHTVAVAIWGEHGPTIVRVEAGPRPVHVLMRHGTVMSVRGTASGRLFAAWLPAAEGGLGTAERDEIRASGIAHAVDGSAAGVSALAAPVFDASGRLVLGLTAIGPTASLDLSPQAEPARALGAAARALSRRLGWAQA